MDGDFLLILQRTTAHDSLAKQTKTKDRQTNSQAVAQWHHFTTPSFVAGVRNSVSQKLFQYFVYVHGNFYVKGIVLLRI